ncbi:MAG: sigma-54-dependent Fis family transcriptional regulator [Paludibacteraceae bacterium]|nr:sigma-54-dependent Fis family transcriptional regulator [Paludibacteraceae bacterium]MBQ2607952.1 sigma-54-dependent Fis family transcriptional regulator [Paludibacteraceae bacterium]
MTQSDIQTIKQRYNIIGTNPRLDRAIEIAVQVAPTDLSVLITGESGVGKEHFPRIIHDCSVRKHGPYFAINCGAIPEGTMDSELFGHEKGAYTDAHAEKKGYFEIANGGTLFLDEVGEMPLQTQVKLLRVLETGEYIRMGGTKVMKTNVRVVAATNLDMRRAIQNGKFREDLYYRLNTVEIRVPALRERKEDIPLLFRKFAIDFSERYRRPAIRLSAEATQLLQNYYWNGNVRQLKNIAEQISVLETQHDIDAETLRKYLPENEQENKFGLARINFIEDPSSREREMLYKLLGEMKVMRQQLDELRAQQKQPFQEPNPYYLTGNETDKNESFQMAEVVKDDVARVEPTPVQVVQEPQTIETLERDSIRRTLELCGGNRKEAAKRLGLSERTLYRKIKNYDL